MYQRKGEAVIGVGWMDGWMYCASIQVTSRGHSGETNQLQSVSESRPPTLLPRVDTGCPAVDLHC